MDDSENPETGVTSLNEDPDEPVNACPTEKKNDLTRAIPKKKRQRLLAEESYGDSERDENEDGEYGVNLPMDVSLSQLKRQVLGRDLKVDDRENAWGEDEDDAEIRLIRALMNASPAKSDEMTKENFPEHAPGSSGNDGTAAAAKLDDMEGGNSGTKTNDSSTVTSTGKSSSVPLLSEKLRKDLVCAICHEVVYPPVALPCGHSFCQPCIDWWFDHDNAERCPTCRRKSKNCYIGPNLALKACVMAMFGPEIIERIQNRKKLRPKGEKGGAHTAGYQVLSELCDETWHYIGVNTETRTDANPSKPNASTIQVRRNIVLDAEDQRMQLALAVYQKPTTDAGAASTRNQGCFRVELCLLNMEEDEAAECGFPTNITTPEDEFFVCGGPQQGSSRFLHTTLDVQMRGENGQISPLNRVSADASDGRFKYTLDPEQSAGNHTTEAIRALIFEHCETGTQLEIDLAQLQNRAGGSTLLPPDRKQSKRKRMDYDSDDEERNYIMNHGDESDGDCEHEDEFEEDGFVVGDDDQDDDDLCFICNDGGELMICDGGDKNPGCGNSFHAACVHRSTIPAGDWICQACAEAGGIEAGVIGHEFPDETQISSPLHQATIDLAGERESDIEGAFSDEEEQQSGDVAASDDEKDDESVTHDKDSEDTPLAKSLGNGNESKTKRRFILDDSDSD